MAPIQAIETIIIVRPLKVTAFVCGLVAVILLIVSVASTAWLKTEGYRQGLWSECVFTPDESAGCTNNEFTDWIIACASLCIISIILTAVAMVVVGIGLTTKDVDRKFVYYRVSMYMFFFIVLLMVISLVVFPVMFIQNTAVRINRKWYFDWAYGVAWGATIFLLGGAILLLIDKESEEVFFQEKTYYHHETTEA